MASFRTKRPQFSVGIPSNSISPPGRSSSINSLHYQLSTSKASNAQSSTIGISKKKVTAKNGLPSAIMAQMEESGPETVHIDEVNGVNIAVVGCAHGCLSDIYASVEQARALTYWDHVDILFINGDFQAVRNEYDLNAMAVPGKFRAMKDFHEYYSGVRQAPVLTLFFGGNHEASNHLYELYYGGWVAPNIYYLGAANVVRFGPLRISGISGIYKPYDYHKSHYERLPYSKDDIKSVFHVRELDVRKLLQIRTQVDICLTHDWPRKIEYTGDYKTLFRKKDGFEQDSKDNVLGSLPAKYILDRLRPVYHFSGHLHVRFASVLEHEAYLKPLPKNHSAGKAARDFTPGNQNSGNRSAEMHSASFSGQKAALPAPARPEANPPRLGVSAWNNFTQNVAANDAKLAADAKRKTEEEYEKFAEAYVAGRIKAPTTTMIHKHPDGTKTKTVEERWPPGLKKFVDKYQQERESPTVTNQDEISLDLSDNEPVTVTNKDEISLAVSDHDSVSSDKSNATSYQTAEPEIRSEVADDVSEELRAQLPAAFKEQYVPEPSWLPLPESIHNRTTRFLALDKCLANREFLRLVNYRRLSNDTGEKTFSTPASTGRVPLQLSYDKEWLAILRVFAPELKLGDFNANVPKAKSEAVYRKLIEEEENWVEENLVKKGKMAIPANFTITAPVYNPENRVSDKDQGKEYTNPQTAAFCDLIGIENQFHSSESERAARMARGPRTGGHARGGQQGPPSTRGGYGRGGFAGRGGRGGGRGGGGGRGRGFHGPRGGGGRFH